MAPTRIKSLALAAALALALLVIPVTAARASSGFTIDLNDTIHATTTLAKLNQTVTLPAGSFVGTVNGDTGKVSGTLKLPNATTTIRVAGVGMADATIAMVPTKNVTGTLNLSTMSIDATATLRIELRRLSPLVLPINLVGSSCETTVPATITFKGVIAASGDVTVTGTYTIPSFMHCDGFAVGLDTTVSGSGNAFHGTLTPVSS